MDILETERLHLREIKIEDYEDICLILQDMDVMYAWEKVFSDKEVLSMGVGLGISSCNLANICVLDEYNNALNRIHVVGVK